MPTTSTKIVVAFSPFSRELDANRLLANSQWRSANGTEPRRARLDTEHCDALVTDAQRILLGVKTADCVPILLGDARTGACAAIHAGWRGTLLSILPRALEQMTREYGTRPSDFRVAIGPAARSCCYEVGAEVIEAFKKSFPDSTNLFTPTRAGHALVDLQRANREQLIESGIAPERIHTAPLCTMCRTDSSFPTAAKRVFMAARDD